MQIAELILLLAAHRSIYEKAAEAITATIKSLEAVHHHHVPTDAPKAPQIAGCAAPEAKAEGTLFNVGGDPQ